MSTRDPPWSSSQDREMDELLALDAAAREARLAGIAREQPERAQRLRDWLRAVEASAGSLEANTADGRRFGPWRAIRLVGRGGMGEVYSGERADGAFERRVAIKRMRPDRATSPAQLARERALLAGLDHPGIARLLDGGALEDGSPWLVTEWIEGTTLDRWLAAQPRSRRERVALLRDVCAAIAYAHGHLVVHRDLKPANVMVDLDGRPHVVDFGIARALDEERSRALTDDRALTPAFAAPEQLTGGAITTRTDVDSLGVLLYWLLTER
ncbi:MAG TPA: serine/threonine-protein kinase, partial [Xanthomonadales bacterium]|nr:serine/threonine-protein kinase [Xanthomonadales bacterium]